MRLTYKNPEGQVWELDQIRLSATFPGFLVGRRKHDNRRVTVEASRVMVEADTPKTVEPVRLRDVISLSEFDEDKE